ncbi:hypothetical protein OIU84_014179 [Salix udensis]|uniref:Major facilitator superfamily (MFS) profile domain-containing protein n=1 Tax=Salix udensis TaxID=889485 RepID=A0AAD6JCF3_9ROSI|nr:hypothetical protein OIU84_014179 [Salix udensis]
MGVQENGNGLVGGKNKYKRMESDVLEEDTVLSSNHQDQEGVYVEKRDTRIYLLACAIFASLNSVLLGYDVGVMSGAILFIKEDLKISEVQEEVLVGILSIVSLLGSLAGGKMSDAIGRKWTIAFATLVFQSGAAIMTLAPSFTVLMSGRILAGVGIGFGVMIAPVYIAEISPSAVRGSLTSFPEIFINLGILLGYISNYAFSGLPVHINWRVMLGIGILPSIFMGVALFVIPESPRWLLAADLANSEKHEAKAVWQELLKPSPAVRKMLITGCGTQCFQQITGIDATVYYSPTIFKDAGIKSETHLLAATVAVGFTKTIFYLNSHISHRQRIGPVCWVLSSEIFPQRLRAQASALGAVGSRVSSGAVSMSFLSVSAAITVGGTFFVFSVISALSVAFVHTCVPETKGKSLEQIEMMFQNGGELQSGEVELGDVEVQRLVQKE